MLNIPVIAKTQGKGLRKVAFITLLVVVIIIPLLMLSTPAMAMIHSLALGNQVGTLTYGTTGSATFSLTGDRDNFGTMPYTFAFSLTGLPAGATYSGVPSTFPAYIPNAPASADITETLIITTSANTPPGVYTLNATLSGALNGPPIVLTATSTLTILLPNSFLNLEVKGIELFAGIDFAKINWGATFVAQAQVTYNGSVYNFFLSASVDYTPDHPVTTGNRIVSGSFTLTAMKSGRSIGMVKGKIRDGSIAWSGGSGTDYGQVVINQLAIENATGIFHGVSGGNFVGTDDHVHGPKIFGITVPTISGTINLTY